MSKTYQTVQAKHADFPELVANVFRLEPELPPSNRGDGVLSILLLVAVLPDEVKRGALQRLEVGLNKRRLLPERYSDHVRLEVQDARRQILNRMRRHQPLQTDKGRWGELVAMYRVSI